MRSFAAVSACGALFALARGEARGADLVVPDDLASLVVIALERHPEAAALDLDADAARARAGRSCRPSDGRPVDVRRPGPRRDAGLGGPDDGDGRGGADVRVAPRVPGVARAGGSGRAVGRRGACSRRGRREVDVVGVRSAASCPGDPGGGPRRADQGGGGRPRPRARSIPHGWRWRRGDASRRRPGAGTPRGPGAHRVVDTTGWWHERDGRDGRDEARSTQRSRRYGGQVQPFDAQHGWRHDRGNVTRDGRRGAGGAPAARRRGGTHPGGS